MTKQELKDKIDLEISNKTATNSVTPMLVGNNMSEIIDLFPNLILSYSGNMDSTTIPLFKDGVMNVYRVTENFTYNTVPLKIGNIVGINTNTILVIADNEKELSSNQLNAIIASSSPSQNNPFVTLSVLNGYNGIKRINTTILPDANGNAVIPNASLTTPGLVTNSVTLQQFLGSKEIRMVGTSPGVLGFSVSNNLGVSIFDVRENSSLNLNGVTSVSSTLLVNGGIIKVNGGNLVKVGNNISLVSETLAERSISLDVTTGNVCIGSSAAGTTHAKFEILATTKVSVAFPKMTNTQRLAITGVDLVEGGGVYVTDTGVTKGIWIYEGAAIGWKQYQKI